MGDVRGSGSGVRQWECGVWKVTVVVPKNKEDEELSQVPPEPGRFSPAKLFGSLGKLEGTDPGHVLESLVESGNWPGRGSACRRGLSLQGVWWFWLLDFSPLISLWADVFALSVEAPCEFLWSHLLASRHQSSDSNRKKRIIIKTPGCSLEAIELQSPSVIGYGLVPL